MTLRDRYCVEVCGGQCCYNGDKKCPNLLNNGKCGIYNKWKNNTCGFVAPGFKTKSIEESIKAGTMHPEAAKVCCYVHPELLEKLNGID